MEGGRVMPGNKAEIDTSAPFRSVKEAVVLFGERVLATEVYANKLKELQEEAGEYGEGGKASELEETKQSLQKAREESQHMAQYLSSLQQELDQTKRELRNLKMRASDKEDFKYVEDSTEVREHVKKETTNGDQRVDFQRRKCVTFANPPLVMTPPLQAVFQRHPSLKKKKKKPLIPFIGGLFSKKKGSSEVAFA